jgi:transcriptional regulator with XRE-family HTH domain
MLLRHAIGAALRRIRLDRQLTLREVALAARVSMPYLSEIERGRKEPSSEVLAGVAGALGLTLVDLLAEVRDEAMVVDLAERREAHAASIPSPTSISRLPNTSRSTTTDVRLAA